MSGQGTKALLQQIPRCLGHAKRNTDGLVIQLTFQLWVVAQVEVIQQTAF